MSSSGAVEVQIVHSIHDIASDAWDCLSGGRGFASHRWYEFGEAVLQHQTPVYVVAHSKGKAVGRATFWLTRDVPLPGVSRSLRRVLGAALEQWPALICRSPLVDCSGLIMPEPPLRQAVQTAITDAIQHWAKQHGASFAVFDYLAESQARAVDWPASFTPVSVQDPGTVMPITFNNFDGWLGGLRSAARKSYRQNCEHAARFDLRTQIHPRVPRLNEALDLVGQVESRHGSPTLWARNLLEHAGMVDGVWISVERDGRPAAGCLYLHDGPAGVLTLLGRDYDVPYAYFQLFYHGIRCAIESGVSVLRGGSGALDLKRRLGFQPEDNNHVAFAATNPLLGWLGRRAAA